MSDFKTLPTSNLVENPTNRRVISRENYQLLLEKLEKKRQYKPLLVTPLSNSEQPSGEYMVLAGNHRLKAYRELGVKELWVSVLEFKVGDDNLVHVFRDGVEETERFQTVNDAMLDWALTDNEEFAENDWDAFVNDMHGYSLDWNKYIMSDKSPKTVATTLKEFLLKDEDTENSDPHECECGDLHQRKKGSGGGED